MYYRGVTDTNTGDPKIIDAAEADVKALVKATDARFDILAYQKIPEGTSHINQAWSGDMVSALQYLPEGTAADVLGYWKPARTTVANDFFVIPARSERPVLAHSLVDFLLDAADAQQNFEFVGYQPAVQKPTPDDLIAAELVPQTLVSTLVTDQDVSGGFRLDVLSSDVEKLFNGPRTAPSRLADVARGEGSKADPQGLWASFTLPGTIWLVALFVVPVLRHRGDRLRRRRSHLRLGRPPLEPADLELHRRPRGHQRDRQRLASRRLRPHLRLRLAGADPVLRHRLPGRLLPRPLRRAGQGGSCWPASCCPFG